MTNSLTLSTVDLQIIGILVFAHAFLAFLVFNFSCFLFDWLIHKFSKHADTCSCAQCGHKFYPDDLCARCRKAFALDEDEKHLGGTSHD